MICTIPKVKGGSNPRDICGGDITKIGTTRPGSREMHTDYACTRCHERWTGEQFALMLMDLLMPILATIKGPSADNINRKAGEIDRALRASLKSPANHLTADSSGEEGFIH